MDKSDQDGAVEARQISPLAKRGDNCLNKVAEEKVGTAANIESSMGAASLEAERRGFDYLQALALKYRKDAEEISLLNKPPDGAPPRVKTNVRGESYLLGDRKTRKKEKLTSVFALSEAEYKMV